MALSDAKGDVDDRVRDLAASERELEKADFDLRYKTHEAKLVNKAAVAKRTEVGEVILALSFMVPAASSWRIGVCFVWQQGGWGQAHRGWRGFVLLPLYCYASESCRTAMSSMQLAYPWQRVE